MYVFMASVESAWYRGSCLSRSGGDDPLMRPVDRDALLFMVLMKLVGAVVDHASAMDWILRGPGPVHQWNCVDIDRCLNGLDMAFQNPPALWPTIENSEEEMCEAVFDGRSEGTWQKRKGTSEDFCPACEPLPQIVVSKSLSLVRFTSPFDHLLDRPT